MFSVIKKIAPSAHNGHFLLILGNVAYIALATCKMEELYIEQFWKVRIDLVCLDLFERINLAWTALVCINIIDLYRDKKQFCSSETCCGSLCRTNIGFSEEAYIRNIMWYCF